MRKSLPKTPPSELNSRVASLLAVAGGRPRAPRTNGAEKGNGSLSLRGASPIDHGARLAARLRLLEGFLGRTDAADCADLGVRCLAESTNVAQALCLIRSRGERTHVTAAAAGFPRQTVMSFTLSLEDWANPLTEALTNRGHAYFPPTQVPADRRRRPVTPFEDAAFSVVPL